MLGTPALAYILLSSVETTKKRFEVEVPSTAVMDMSGVSAGTSVTTVVVMPADNSLPTLRVEALSPSNGPRTSISLASLNSTFDEDITIRGDPHSGFMHELMCWIWSWVRACRVRGWQLRGSPSNLRFVAYFVVVVLDQELHPNQTVYVLIDARAVLDSSKLFVGLAGT